MTLHSKRLSEQAAEDILNMITVKKKYLPGDKLPNENDLSAELKISRTTLREAIRILITHNILEIKRGKGTYVVPMQNLRDDFCLDDSMTAMIGLKDLMEIRLIIEPEIVYYAAKRASDKEIEKILYHGELIENKIRNGEDRTEEEQLFHNSIAKSTHNDFINRLMPIINQGIYKGVILSKEKCKANDDTLVDHRVIMDHLKKRDADGARIAMKLHIIRAMDNFGLSRD
ncbi:MULTISPECIES: FadR/GntR family transcriptional regulator [unclassified Sedimentibacter]|uniref:FadR/GntR family transcriptional regulator n=1 Tax=unclassified Sedimentibacter TaxID=2649220 RepID=UPI0027DFC2CA|nr:FadR/GntR family transcriptional regulator [Sedimentibacter sp. MB35-C1]WMJ79025.1 FadR/GntR family transcriptional regulator [Sedimentibacter sp. MB35-C1]